MSVKLSSVLKNVASENYDKGNVLLYIIICCISSTTGYISNINKATNLAILPLLLIIGILCSIIIIGTSILATHNAIHRIKGVFPNPFKEFCKIIAISFKAGIGSFVFWLIPTVILTIGVILLSANALLQSGQPNLTSLSGAFIIYCILCFLLLIIFSLLYYAFYLNYATTLKLKDFLNFKKGFSLFGKIKGQLIIFIIILFSICAIITYIMMPIMQKIQTGLISMPIAITFMVILSFFQSIIGVYIIEYLAQIVRSTLPKKKKPLPTKIREEKT